MKCPICNEREATENCPDCERAVCAEHMGACEVCGEARCDDCLESGKGRCRVCKGAP